MWYLITCCFPLDIGPLVYLGYWPSCIFRIFGSLVYFEMFTFWQRFYTLSFKALPYALQLWLITSTLGSFNSSNQQKIWFSFCCLPLGATQSVTPSLMRFYSCIFKLIAMSTVVPIIVDIVHGVSSFKMATVYHFIPISLAFYKKSRLIAT